MIYVKLLFKYFALQTDLSLPRCFTFVMPSPPKKKRKKRGQLEETGGSGESSPKKARSSGRTITKKTK